MELIGKFVIATSPPHQNVPYLRGSLKERGLKREGLYRAFTVVFSTLLVSPKFLCALFYLSASFSHVSKHV